MKKFIEKDENKIFIVVFLITMFVACSKLMTKLCVNGHDLEYHLLRIEALKEGILMGKPFLKVNALFFGGAGYASSMFYPDFLLYVPALLRVIGIGINQSYHVFVAMCIILCYLSTYYSVKGITKNCYAGLISAVMLCLCNYHLDDIYVRGAVGEYTAFIFIPLIIYGIYNTVYEQMDKPYVLGVGFAGVLLCHTLSFAICACVTVFVFIVNIRVFVKNPKVILKLMITAFFSALITCTYWLPMMEQMISDSFYVSTEQWADLALTSMQISSIVANVFPSIGFGIVLACVPVLFLKKTERDDAIKYAMLLSLVGIVMAFSVSDLFPWARLSRFLSFLQFPWRLFLVASVCLSMASGIILSKIASSVRLTRFLVFTEKNDGQNVTKEMFEKLIVSAIIVIMSVTALDTMKTNDLGYYDYSNDYYTYKPFTATVIGGEWLPSRVSDMELLVEQSENAYSSSGESAYFERMKNEIVISSAEQSEYYDVPFVYYKGYAAKGEDGTEFRVSGEGNNGLTRIYTNGYTGGVRVYYRGTFMQHIALGATISGIVLLVLALIMSRRKK